MLYLYIDVDWDDCSTLKTECDIMKQPVSTATTSTAITATAATSPSAPAQTEVTSN